MKKVAIILLIILTLIFSACTLYVAQPVENSPSDSVVEQQVIQQPETNVTQVPNVEEQTTQPASQPQTREFSVMIAHTSYNPNTFTVNKGDTVRFSAKAAPGTSSHVHGITIDEYDVNQAVTSESTPFVIEFVADRAGTFSIWCKTCWDGPFGRGHPDIRGTLLVEE